MGEQRENQIYTKQDTETRYHVVSEGERGRDGDCLMASKFLRASIVLLPLASRDPTGTIPCTFHRPACICHSLSRFLSSAAKGLWLCD